MSTSANLIVNPGAETGPGGGGSPAGQIPGWQAAEGGVAVIRYDTGGGYPGPGDPGPPDRGVNFFGGGTSPKSRITQEVTLPDQAEIDAGLASYRLGGWFGGYAGQEDSAQLTAEFLGASGQVLGSATAGPVSASDRGGVTKLLERSVTAAIPAGARKARLSLLFTRKGGSSNDGYADSLTLTVTVGAPPSGNLIVNPSAEGSAGGSGEPSATIPGWITVEGAASVVRYGTSGGYPTASDPGPSDRGANFLAGGNSARTRLAQTVTLPGVADIDAGRARFTFGGWLGGYLTQEDGVRLSVEFLPASGPPLGLVVLGPVTSGDRGGRTGLFYRSATGTVPPGSRTARVLLLFGRAGGTSNDGYADALTLTIGAA
ncbi:hypothetical protein [Longispora albida]|uniref:hypothetical protein n=1 Tax=Longispora albida TaxID=203523 RepID=UPI00036699F6|nr:hypothetical protein [Longispora albida]